VKVFLPIGLVLVLVFAVLTYPGAIAVSMIVHLTPAPGAFSPAPAGTVPWLHVAHPSGGRPYIADDQGRMVLLHGAIPAGLLDFWSGTDPKNLYPPPFYPIDPAAYANGCPDNSPVYHYPPLCKSDLSDMAVLGFNSIRLPLSWSLLEPQRGKFSQTYVDRVAQVVDWARALGLYVIIDMHQNAYSRFVDRPANPPLPGGQAVDLSSHSGAPAWATITDGFPSEDFAGHRELSPAVFEAFSNFWYNRDGIQDEYIAALAFLAKRFTDDSVVAGYSIFNEPLEGWNVPPGFEDLLLWPFYRRVIDALTGTHDGLPCWTGTFMPAVCGYRDLGVHDLRHLFFLDTGLLREVTDFPTHLGLPVSSYPNLVLGVHAYTHIYTFDTFAKEPADKANYPWGGYEQGFAWADREAKGMNAALFVMEFGDSPEWDHEIVNNVLLKAEQHDVSFAFWTWKENGGSGSWGVFNPPTASSATSSSGCLRAARERLLARVYPRASADASLTYHYDAESGAFALSAKGKQGDPATLVSIPPEVTGAVSTTGAVQASIRTQADGSRLVTASPSGGSFSIAVAPASLSLSGCA
jgi:endoglycosylceramidase